MRLLLLPFLLLACLVSIAQDSFQLSGRQILPGQKFSLTYPLQNASDSLLLADSLKPLMLLSSIRANGKQTLVATMYDTGLHRIPALSTARGKTFLTDTLRVLPLPADSLKGYAELKTAIPPRQETNWLLIGAAILTIAFLAFLVYNYFKRRRTGIGKKLEALSRPEAWQKEMRLLQTQWQGRQLEAYPAADKLLLLLRALLHAGGRNTSHLTAREAIGEAGNHFGQQQHQQLKEAVEASYLMLFAQHNPTTAEFAGVLKQTEASGMEYFKKEAGPNG